MRLQDQVAVVTGGGRGIGGATALALAAEGAAVGVLARTQTEIDEVAGSIQEDGRKALAVTADVTVESQVDHALSAIANELGPIDLLVNNAGGGSAIGPVWEVDAEEWWSTVEVNLRSVFLCSRAVLPGMIERGRGRIVNVSSGLALRPMPNGTPYTVAKAAALRFTDSLALEVAPHGINVFAASPGLVRTAMTDYLIESEAGKRWLPQMQHVRESMWVPVEKGAALIVAIAAGDADALSGRYIHVSDDLADLVKRADEIRANDTHTLRLQL